MHDAAACAIGIVTMLPLMRAVGIEPHTNTAKFMMLSLRVCLFLRRHGNAHRRRSLYGVRSLFKGIYRH